MSLLRTSRPRKQPTALVGMVEPSVTAATPMERDFQEVCAKAYAPAVDEATQVIGYDAALDAFWKTAAELWDHWAEKLPEERTVGAFVKAVRFRVVDHMRAAEPFVSLTEQVEQTPEFGSLIRDSITGEIEANDLNNRILRAMPPRRRQALLLYIDGYSYQEIAETLTITHATVATHMRQARESYARALERAGIRFSPATLMKMLPSTTSETTDD